MRASAPRLVANEGGEDMKKVAILEPDWQEGKLKSDPSYLHFVVTVTSETIRV